MGLNIGPIGFLLKNNALMGLWDACSINMHYLEWAHARTYDDSSRLCRVYQMRTDLSAWNIQHASHNI